MRQLWIAAILCFAIVAACSKPAARSDPGQEAKVRTLIPASCWSLSVRIAENAQVPSLRSDSLAFTSEPSKYAETKRQTKYTNNVRHRLADKYGLPFADNCFDRATIDIVLFASKTSLSYTTESGAMAEQGSGTGSPYEQNLSQLHKPPSKKKMKQSFDEIMKVEVRFITPGDQGVEPITIWKETDAGAVADAIAAHLHISK